MGEEGEIEKDGHGKRNRAGSGSNRLIIKFDASYRSFEVPKTDRMHNLPQGSV